MNSLISVYSLEGNDGGTPNGQFFLDKEGAKAVAEEVVQTHFGFTGAKRVEFLKDRFPRAWDNIDVNHDGQIEVARAAVLLRMIVGEVETNDGL